MAHAKLCATAAPDVDISVVTFNSAKWLPAFLESLCQQNFDMSRVGLYWRDNGSADDTLEQLQRLAAEHACRFRCWDVEAGENLGFGQGHNRNLSRSAAPFFLVTNADLVLEADALRCVLEMAVGSAPEVACWELRQKPYEHPKYYNPISLETEWASSACALFRRTALEALGGYEPRLFLYGEDVELSFRLRDNGYVLCYCPQAVCWHFTYDTPNQLKQAQYLGSTLANGLLRLRYGTLRQCLAVPLMYLSLWFSPVRFEGRIKGLAGNGLKLIKLTPYFLRTRKKSGLRFPFRLWDYSIARDGAFHEFQPVPDDVPRVSIIVRTCKGRLGKLKEAVESVRHQTYPNIELVIVEDGSDEAQGFAESVASEGRLASVQYQALAKVGRCVAGNTGLSVATGEYLCFLDDDDAFFADHVEVLAHTLQTRQEIAAAYALAFQVPTRIHSHSPWEYDELGYEVIHRQPFSRALLWHHNYIPIQAILFRRTLFERYGGFNVDLENLEDWNLWVRYSLSNDFALVEKVTSLYRVPAESGDAMQRQAKLDEFYALATARNDELCVTLTPSQVVEYARELAREFIPVGVSRTTLRQLFFRLPLAGRAYFMAARAASLMRRVGQKFARKTH